MASIAQIVEFIRTAVFGKDVRENIAKGIETIDDRVSSFDKIKLNAPSNGNDSYGKILQSTGDGGTHWTSFGLPTDQQTSTAVTEWLNDHPEATTTVEDGAITSAKLDTDLYKMYKEAGKVQFFVPGQYNQDNEGAASGATCLMVTPNKTVLFDAGEQHHRSEIIAFYDELYDAGVFSNIDYVIISHYHGDHVQNYGSILDAFPHVGCKTYGPMDPTGHYGSSSGIVSLYNAVKTSATNHSVQFIEVDEETDLQIDYNVSINLFNSDPENYAYYDELECTYNEYCMVALIKIGDGTYAMMPGDLSVQGQKRVMTYKDLPRLSFYLVHHHGVNRGNGDFESEQYNKDYLPYYYKINPLYSVIPDDLVCAMNYGLFGLYQKIIKGFIGQCAYDYYSLVCDGSSCNITHGKEILESGNNGTHITIYVNNEYTGNEHLGTVDKPFKNFKEVMRFLKDGRDIHYQIKLVKTDTPYPILIRDINSELRIQSADPEDKAVISSIEAQRCTRVYFNGVIIRGPGAANRPASGWYCPIALENTYALFTDCEIDGSLSTDPTKSCGMILSASIARLIRGSIHDFVYGFRPWNTSSYSIVEASGTAFHDITRVFQLYCIDYLIFDGCTFGNDAEITDIQWIFEGGDRLYPFTVYRGFLTPSFAAKCSGSSCSKVLYKSSIYPAVMISNSKLYNVLTGEEITS